MTCPQCGGEGHYMGSLGRKQWFRCRSCGWEFAGQLYPVHEGMGTDARQNEADAE